MTCWYVCILTHFKMHAHTLNIVVTWYSNINLYYNSWYGPSDLFDQSRGVIQGSIISCPIFT